MSTRAQQRRQFHSSATKSSSDTDSDDSTLLMRQKPRDDDDDDDDELSMVSSVLLGHQVMPPPVTMAQVKTATSHKKKSHSRSASVSASSSSPSWQAPVVQQSGAVNPIEIVDQRQANDFDTGDPQKIEEQARPPWNEKPAPQNVEKLVTWQRDRIREQEELNKLPLYRLAALVAGMAHVPLERMVSTSVDWSNMAAPQYTYPLRLIRQEIKREPGRTMEVEKGEQVPLDILDGDSDNSGIEMEKDDNEMKTPARKRERTAPAKLEPKTMRTGDDINITIYGDRRRPRRRNDDGYLAELHVTGRIKYSEDNVAATEQALNLLRQHFPGRFSRAHDALPLALDEQVRTMFATLVKTVFNETVHESQRGAIHAVSMTQVYERNIKRAIEQFRFVVYDERRRRYVYDEEARAQYLRHRRQLVPECFEDVRAPEAWPATTKAARLPPYGDANRLW